MQLAHVAPLALLAVAIAGCTGGTPSCAIEASPQEPPEDRTAFNVTEEVKAEHQLLAELFGSPGTTIDVGCEDGDALFQELEDDGADVSLKEGNVGHDVYLRHGGTTYYTILAQVVD